MITSPLTGKPTVTELKVIKTDDLVRDWKTYFDIDITTELHGCKEIYQYRCDETKLKFFVPEYLVGSEKLYAQLQKFEWFYMDAKWEFDVAMPDLYGSHRILEIGSGTGGFILRALNTGFNIRGLELNPSALAIAQNRNLPVENIDLSEVATQFPDYFDAICSFQVLEHVPNPKDFLHWAIETLKPGGKLIICVPNSDSFLKYQYNLLDMPPHHMTQWSRDSLISLEKIFPLRVLSVKYEPLASYHVAAYLQAYSGHYKPRSALARIVFSDFMTTLYEKVMMSGWRRLFRGQSIYCCFEKI